MPKLAVAKWYEFRELYERHFVSMEMIAKLGKVQLLTVQRIAERSGWRVPVHTANRLRFRLAQDVLEHLERLKNPHVDEAVEEKRARGMLLTAKTLESIDLVERRLWLDGGEIDMGENLTDRNSRPDDTIPLDEGTIGKITSDLERLVRKVESQRGDEVS